MAADAERVRGGCFRGRTQPGVRSAAARSVGRLVAGFAGSSDAGRGDPVPAQSRSVQRVSARAQGSELVQQAGTTMTDVLSSVKRVTAIMPRSPLPAPNRAPASNRSAPR